MSPAPKHIFVPNLSQFRSTTSKISWWALELQNTVPLFQYSNMYCKMMCPIRIAMLQRTLVYMIYSEHSDHDGDGEEV
jgi:hypothetical protein